MKLINFKKKNIKLLINEQQKSNENAEKLLHVQKKNKKIEFEYAKDKKYCKVRDNCHYTTDEHAHRYLIESKMYLKKFL